MMLRSPLGPVSLRRRLSDLTGSGQLRAPTLYKVYIATPLPDAEPDAAPEDDAATHGFALAAWAQYAAACGR